MSEEIFDVLDDRDPLGQDFPRVTLNSINSTSYVFVNFRCTI